MYPGGVIPEAVYTEPSATGTRPLVDDAAYLAAMGLSVSRARAAEVWRHLAVELLPGEFFTTKRGAALETTLVEGVLARRIVKALGPGPDRERIRAVYGELSRCLAEATVFAGLQP